MNLLNRLRLFRFGQHFDSKKRTLNPLFKGISGHKARVEFAGDVIIL